jgi:transcription termination/antitermination protein NusG
MMQHRGFTGVAIATRSRASFDDLEREARLEALERASRIINPESPWFALRVMTGKEVAVQEALEVLGITSLVPMRKGPDLRRRHRVIPGSLQPVIYGYVLVQSDPAPDVLVSFKGLDDVIGVLGGAEKPMRVTASEIKCFKAMADAGLYDWEKPCGLIVAAGDRVRTTDGPFSGFIATVVTPNGKGKGDVVISVDIFGRETPVTVPLVILEKL